jgi:hypothetical protein
MERPTVKRTKKKSAGKVRPHRTSVKGLEAMLDYAIVEGAELRLSLFVSLLRLAKLALKEERTSALRPKH